MRKLDRTPSVVALVTIAFVEQSAVQYVVVFLEYEAERQQI